ncbi:MAG: divalent-cation tolerance protein CutA [Endomicrobia bacterium]|nr:divalent-cation tolerance protein CutA [Endomicrobiia bacterium]MCL2799463.1 divalent-cation tolerance protein CutA [Endomicrobiia bacterium]
MKTPYIIVFVTVPDRKTANKIKNIVLENKIAACVSVTGGVSSFYWWKGKIGRAKEYLLVMKTVKAKFSDLEKRVKKVHPYEVPEIIAADISAGSKDYLDWIKKYACGK